MIILVYLLQKKWKKYKPLSLSLNPLIYHQKLQLPNKKYPNYMI